MTHLLAAGTMFIIYGQVVNDQLYMERYDTMSEKYPLEKTAKAREDLMCQQLLKYMKDHREEINATYEQSKKEKPPTP